MNNLIKNLGGLLGPSKVWWLIRQLLQFGGLWLVATGRADQESVTTATTTLLEVLAGIGMLIGFGANIFSSFRPAVTVHGEKVPLDALPADTKSDVKVEAKQVIKEKNILESIFGARKKS